MSISIPFFDRCQIAVAGDIMLDRYWGGGTHRISPEAPVPVVKIADCSNQLGGAANVAANLSQLGCKVRLGGLSGNDEAADIISQQLNELSIDNHVTRSMTTPTVTKLRVISRQQQLIRLDFEENASSVDNSKLLENIDTLLKNCDALVLSDYAKGCIANAQPFIRAAKAMNIPVLVDPKGNDYQHYHGATLLTPNLAEFESIVGHCSDDNIMSQKAGKLMQELKLDGLLVTLSERGMALFRPSQEPLIIPAEAREVYDVTGAGDTVIAALAATLASGGDMIEAVKLANLAAGVVVGKFGTASTSRDELCLAAETQQLRRQQSQFSNVVSETQLLEKIKKLRQRGETIAMTNGCFDILHPGHIAYLQKASQMADHLIVAVNSDTSVKRLKGSKRPINPLDNRMALLAALKSVDWVVPFNEDTPERLIGEILPDFLVKGGDYKAESLAGYTTVKQNGGEVIIIDFEEGHSSTAIIEKIQALNDG